MTFIQPEEEKKGGKFQPQKKKKTKKYKKRKRGRGIFFSRWSQEGDKISLS